MKNLTAESLKLTNHFDFQGIFISGNNGATWESYNNGIENLNITRLKMNHTNPGNLFAGTKDGGVWMTALKENATYISIIKKPDIPFYIYPNPNNGTFNIVSYSDSALKGNLKIISLLGEVIYSDNNLEIDSNSTYELNINNVIPGNYILTFKSDKLIINRKVIFIK